MVKLGFEENWRRWHDKLQRWEGKDSRWSHKGAGLNLRPLVKKRDTMKNRQGPPVAGQAVACSKTAKTAFSLRMEKKKNYFTSSFYKQAAAHWDAATCVGFTPVSLTMSWCQHAVRLFYTKHNLSLTRVPLSAFKQHGDEKSTIEYPVDLIFWHFLCSCMHTIGS